MSLDISSLRSACVALNKSLGYLNADLAADLGLREQFRSACIQAFGFTHEVGFKMLRRQLEQMSADPAAVDQMTYMEIIRSGAEAGLILDIARFRKYRDMRNITSHTYDEEKAKLIVSILGEFSADMDFLRYELEVRNSHAD